MLKVIQKFRKINNSSQVQNRYLFIDKLKAIKNTIEVSYLFILQLWFWFRNLEPPALNFNLISNLIPLSLTFCYCCWSGGLLFQHLCLLTFLLESKTVRGDLTSPKIRVFQDLAAFIIVRHPTYSFSIKLILHWELGFSRVDHLTTFYNRSIGPNNTKLYTLQHYCHLSYGFY